MKYRLRIMFLGILFAVVASLGMATKTHAATNERMMDDAVFDDSQSMQATDIQNFLNVFPNSCLKNYTDEFPYDYDNFSGSTSAAWIIRRASDLWGVSPKVLLAKIEQESNLVTGSGGCAQWRYISSMGYRCPTYLSENPRTTIYKGQTVQTCVEKDSDMGFVRQITRGAWQLKFDKERSIGNISWLNNSNITYNGKFVNPGLHKRCASCRDIYDDGVFNGVDIQTGATAAFYNYTPYLNQGFDEIYEKWFGSTYSGQCISALNLPTVMDVVFNKRTRGKDFADLIVYSGTGTKCIESHVWNSGMQSWQAHIATNQPVVGYPANQVMFGDLDGTKLDYPLLFGVQSTSTAKVESHVWDRSMKNWLAHSASNQPVIDPGVCKIIILDLDGDQREDVTLVCLSATASGKIEYQTWNPGMQSWRNKVVTNRNVIDPALNTVVGGDIDGNGADELILINYNNTGSGRVEFHVWNTGQQTWWYHIATNMPSIQPALTNSKIEFADLDGNGVDEPVYVKMKNTGSGKIEFHVWNPGYYSWKSNIASNQASI